MSESPPPPAPDHDAPKRAAAARAIAAIDDGMVVGLGTGSTAAFAIKALGARVGQGLRIAGIPTSENSAALARQYRIPLTSFAEHRRIDLTIDGADQVARGTLDLVKGLGGALLREKIVAAASNRMIIMVDDSKIVPALGGHTAIPVEIVAFGWQTVIERLTARGYAPRLRMAGVQPFVTDGGNYIADCAIATIEHPGALEIEIKSLTGVVEVGLFIGLATEVIVGKTGGTEVMVK